MHGTSFAASLTDGAAPEHRTQQYFETIGNRGMYKDGWWLAMKTERIPWVLTPAAIAPYVPGSEHPRPPARPSCTTCPTISRKRRTLPPTTPRRSRQLKDLFWEEAEKYKVLPLLATLSTFFGMLSSYPGGNEVRVPG